MIDAKGKGCKSTWKVVLVIRELEKENANNVQIYTGCISKKFLMKVSLSSFCCGVYFPFRGESLT